ncbi:polycystin-1 [Genypterus blacodes]|uniref:polycystin-1 n=1 Tax=Genypterus blacodes TaxID=154954 RepID=UPI003F757954
MFFLRLLPAQRFDVLHTQAAACRPLLAGAGASVSQSASVSVSVSDSVGDGGVPRAVYDMLMSLDGPLVSTRLLCLLPRDKGGRVHLAGLRCYWLSEMTSSWPEAQARCRQTPGGDLAAAGGPDLQTFIQDSFPAKAAVWVWMRAAEDQGGAVEPASPDWTGGGEGQRLCEQTALGTRGQWRRTKCDGQHRFLCERQVTDWLPSLDSYLTGTVLMSGVYASTHTHTLPTAPSIRPITAEMQLFPGLWFSHAGRLVSVDLVVQPGPVSTLARLQVLRPYCSPSQHLVPPGCSFLLNPFSCCSAVPLCNTTGGCSVGRYWCHLLEACLSTSSPCSPYDPAAGGHKYDLPPRYPAVPPFYHLVADLPLRVNPSSELTTISLELPEREILLYPDDIVALQHTRHAGSFLHCLDADVSLRSPWRQSYLSLQGGERGGWWEGGLTSLPEGGQWVDGVVCDLRMLSVDAQHRSTGRDQDVLGSTGATAAPHTGALTGPALRSGFGLHVVHPPPDEDNQIHVQINIPTLIVVQVSSGHKATSSWSNPVLQTGVPFLPSCPEKVSDSWPDCESRAPDAWFSSVTLLLPSVGVNSLNITAVKEQRAESVGLTVCGYQAVSGLSVEPHGRLRILTHTSQSFAAKVELGSSVSFIWVIDNLEMFAHEGDSYSVVFQKPAEYKIKVTASNPVSSESQQILLTAEEMSPMAEPHFLSVREVVGVSATHSYTLRVRADVSLGVTFRWDFGDGSSEVTHTHAAPYQSMEGPVERGQRHVYVQDSFNHTYSTPGDYTLHVQVSNQYDSIETSMPLSVRPQLDVLHVSSSRLVSSVNQLLHLEASAEPSSSGLLYTWSFGDGTFGVHGNGSKVDHAFASAGVYNVSVTGDNSVTALSAWILLEVMEEISGLTIRSSRTSELNSAAHLRAEAAAGSALIWDFDFGDGSLQRKLTHGSVSHIYETAGNYTVSVNVSNAISRAQGSVSLEVYRLAVSAVLPTECVLRGSDIQLSALVKGNTSTLAFHWSFGDGSPLVPVRGKSTTTHRFTEPGVFPLSLTVLSSITSSSFNTSICVQAPITHLSVQAPQAVVASGQEACFNASVSPQQASGYQFEWFSSSSSSSSQASVLGSAEKCFVFEDEGEKEVSVKVSNKVSHRASRASVRVQRPVSALSVMHDGQSHTLTAHTSAWFWVHSCSGSNVSVLWDFGDGSPEEQRRNVSHVFSSSGLFTVTAQASNAVSRDTVTLRVQVLLPVSDLTLHLSRPYAAVGEETLITAVSGAVSTTGFYWTVDGLTTAQQGSHQFRFTFPRPGVFQVRATAQNQVSRKEAAVLVEVFERIQGLQIECQSVMKAKFIPTQEETLFTASVTKGSSVTFDWLAAHTPTHTHVTGDGQTLHLSAETHGNISVQLRASNRLGHASTVLSVVAVERVTSATVTTQSDILAMGKPVNFSVSVVTGSDLQYFWYLNFDLSPLQTPEPLLLHTLTHAGTCFVEVSVQNVLGCSNVTKQFEVQEEIRGADFVIDGKTRPLYISTHTAVPLRGLVHEGSHLHWDWRVDEGAKHTPGANQTFVYTFTHAGTHQVSLNVSNRLSWQTLSHSVNVQDAIKGLKMNVSKSTVCTEDKVVFKAAVTRGSNVSFSITFSNNRSIQDAKEGQIMEGQIMEGQLMEGQLMEGQITEGQITEGQIMEGQFSTLSLPAGTHWVTVKAQNSVSAAQVTSSLVVLERIGGLRLVNCCSEGLEAMKEIQLRAEVQSGHSVTYTWVLGLEGAEPSRAEGQEVTLSLAESGVLSVSVEASNGVCSETLKDTAAVQRPVRTVELLCASQSVFTGFPVWFTAKVDGGSNLSFHWEFGDSTGSLVTNTSSANHTYRVPGTYNATIKAFNQISHVLTQLHVEVKELLCSRPQVSLVLDKAKIFRSRPRYFETSVDLNCFAYKTTYLWEVLRQPDCTETWTQNPVFLRNQTDVTSVGLWLPKQTLEVGRYCLVFTVSFQGTPLRVQQRVQVSVIHSPLVAVIKGGTRRLWPSSTDLVLDGSESQDPDVEPGGEEQLWYHWSFVTQNSTEPQVVGPSSGSSSSLVTLLSTHLHPGLVYLFTLTVHKAERDPVSTTQTVTVCEAAVFPVSVECASCSARSSPGRLSSSSPTVLSAQCGQCDDQAQYAWTAVDQSGLSLDLDPAARSPHLVVGPGVLQDGQSYTFNLNVSQPGTGRWGSAGLTLQTNLPPQGGACELSPESNIELLETRVTCTCSGWRDEDSEASQLIYTLQVAPCQHACPLLTLYRGTRSTFGSLVPAGSPGPDRGTSLITVTVLVEDDLGAKVTALNRTVTVYAMDQVGSRWLRNKTQTELWVLVQHGNPQEILSYSVALSSRLNQMASAQSERELRDRREIRENVTDALTSLPISSMMDVDQISSALAQSTAVPTELACEERQEKVLAAVGKMIGVLEAERSVAMTPALDTERNLLAVIGGTLAALSDSSAMALSALDHAGTLVRSVMRSRVSGEASVSLSTRHISTAGFHGDPSHLLCTDASQAAAPPCQFHIPASLADHLKNERSEVMQVLLNVDTASLSNPLLTQADPPISTNLVAMEFTTPQGQHIPIQDLDPDQAIRVTLPHKLHPGQSGVGGSENETSPGGIRAHLPTEGWLNFTVKAVDGLDHHAGLYISFSFSLAPGAGAVSLGHVSVAVSANASQGALLRRWPLSLSTGSCREETVFLSPLLNGSEGPVSVGLKASLAGPGGPVQVSACVFSTVCRYYSVKEGRWCSEGLQPLEGSSLQAVHCLTRHLTVFGASLFVHPGAVVLLPPSGGPVRNVLVGMVCAVLLLIHLLLGLAAHKLDHMDSLRLSQVPLCGRPGLYHYRVLVKTGRRRGAGTSAHVGISLYGLSKSGSRHLQRDGAFQRGSLDQFHLETDDNLGEVWKIRLWHDNTGLDPSWYVQHVVVWDPQTDHMFFFLLEDWLSVDNQKNHTVEKEVLASCPEELAQFRRVLSSQLTFGMVERHLWVSLWERPAHSRFSRTQRVACSALLLHLYLALGALWCGAVSSEGHSGPVSDQQLIGMETVAVGITIAALLFPLQCFLCFLFRKAHRKITVDMSVPPSPVCHSVEMDVYLGQSHLCAPSFLSLADSSCPAGDSPSSLLESKAFDSSILDFWAASGLAPPSNGGSEEEGVRSWPSDPSLLNPPVSPPSSTALGPGRLLRRKKALMQLRLASPSSPDSARLPHTYTAPLTPRTPQAHSQNLTTILTLSEEDLLMSIAAAADESPASSKQTSSADSGRDSPQSSCSLSRSASCSSWSEPSEDEKSPYEDEDIQKPDPGSYPSPGSVYGTGLSRCPSVVSIDSVASTFLPSPSPDSTRSTSTTRIGVARGGPSWLLPPWALRVLYPLVLLLLGACLSVVVLYGRLFSRPVFLMWLMSALSAFLTSALLLEPLKVCVQAVLHTALWRPVDPEAEDYLARETTVIRAGGEQGGEIRPPCGYGLLQAKEEARKVRALRSLMRQCVCQLLFLLLVLMLNYQDGPERLQARLLRSAVTRRLHRAATGVPNLTSLRDWSDADRWLELSLVPHLHQSPELLLVGTPELQHTHTHTHTHAPITTEAVALGNSSVATLRLLADLQVAAWTRTQFKVVSVAFTHYHRESGVFLCVSLQLDWTQTRRISASLSVHPLFIPSSSSGVDLQVALTVLLLLSGLLLLCAELVSMATQRSLSLSRGRRWFQLLLALLSVATSALQFCFLSRAASCVTKLRSQTDDFIHFHSAALLAEASSQAAALLLTLLLLKLLGTLRFVRRWVVMGRVLHRAWRELRALIAVLLLLLLLCAHVGNTLFSGSVEGFLSVRQAGVSALSILRGRLVLQRLCRVHPVLGPLYGLALIMGGLWFLARLCGAALLRTYRAEQAHMYRPTMEPQDYEMVEFFIKRLRLWMGLTKAKEFRHRVKFEGMDVPPSRSSQESRLSTLSSALPSSCSPSLSSSLSSPRPLSSSLSVRSEDSSTSEPVFDVQLYLDRLSPCVAALLSRFDRVNQLTQDVQNLEMKLEEVQCRRRRRKRSNDTETSAGSVGESGEPKEVGGEGKGEEAGEVRRRKTGFLLSKPRISLPSYFSCNPSALHSSSASASILPRTRSSYSESESSPLQLQPPAHLHPSEAVSRSPGFRGFPRRRAWHSGCSHSADAAQRVAQAAAGVFLSGNGGDGSLASMRPMSEEEERKLSGDGAPVKRKAWTSEGPDPPLSTET